MRIALAFGVCLLGGLAGTLLAAAADTDTAKTTTAKAKIAEAIAQTESSAQRIRERYRAQLNDNTVTIMAGSGQGTDSAIVQDLAAVLDDGAALRVVPMGGKGPAHNLKDVMFMRGVDMGITQANVLKHFAKTGELGPNLESQVAYIAKLFNEEMHVLVRADITDVAALDGKTVNIGIEGSGAEITARSVFNALGVTVQEVHLDEAAALAKLKAGAIDATVIIAGKPAPILAHLEPSSGLKLLGLPYLKGLEDDYYPAALGHDDYPQLIADGDRVDTVAVCAVLVSFNWARNNPRNVKIDRFVERFFSNFDAFLAPPRHPKWRQVNFAATLEGWQRSPAAQAWIDRAKATVAANAGIEESADDGARARFDTFLAQADTGAAAASDDERARLFRAFLEWSRTQNQN
ncbi:MAG TPA: TAXI family TRAP transporter solute-binding subunit [Methyloceanibacter sp.]|nr:TAXI family TRAP transporter solute-binding subunit [Methyloceanibacter sp.]